MPQGVTIDDAAGKGNSQNGYLGAGLAEQAARTKQEECGVAQRSPIRSFLSVVPSEKAESGEPTKRVKKTKTKTSGKKATKSASRKSVPGTRGDRPLETPPRDPRKTGSGIPTLGDGEPAQSAQSRSHQAQQQQQSQQLAEQLRMGRVPRSRNQPDYASLDNPRPPRGSKSRDRLAEQRPYTSLSRHLPQEGSDSPRERVPGRRPPDSGNKPPRKRTPKSPSKRTAGTSSKPSSPQARTRKTTEKKPKRTKISPLIYGARLLILGVGLGVLAGTLLSIWNPADNHTVGAAGNAETQEEQQEQVTAAYNLQALPISQEITTLKEKLQAMAAEHPELTPGVYAIELDTGAYLDLNGSQRFSAASTIKVPILIAFFQDVDAGKITLNEMLTMKEEHIAEGSGDMQFTEPGTKYSALETATKMSQISDNTATNMLIERLGGAAALNQRFASWGLSNTAIANPLPDLAGTNTTSPQDLVQVMGLVERGQVLSLRSRDRLLKIMQGTVNNSLLPQGLGSGAAIAHKTGDIGTAISDAGLVDMPNGKRYLMAAIVKRPHNDPEAEELIRQMSQVVYQSFSGEL
ncbi:hydrolase [Oscillatoria acuminata]|uniref:Beta-lactamase class A n=1 Tax=Oscillatoria acuminata PCC 6304 TaxID=56110 RepID=K9TTS6_9CYAN|nr:hydrolase [Oscillatoria acuminata]AFY85404.1 beta-lactamase class A [Oscillatoria acuminata PCC 6304]